MLVKRMSLVFLLGFLLMAGYGCGRPNIIGGDAGVYSGGRLYAVSTNDLNTVYNASVKALEDLEIGVTDKLKDVFSAKVIGEAADGKTVAIIIKPQSDSVTELSIKVGTLGNEYKSRVVYEKIRENLGNK